MVPQRIYLCPRNLFLVFLSALGSCLHQPFHDQYKHCACWFFVALGLLQQISAYHGSL